MNIGSKAKKFQLQYLQFLNMRASGGSPDRTCIVHHGKDELLIEQNAIPDGQAAFLV
jgi:hypothetical protein